jgi:ADP-ribosylglycohydrolase
MHKTDLRISGCILGGAIGDCLGGPYEGQPPPVRIDIHQRWRTSDDTQLTLATCEAISERMRIDPAGIAGRFAVWFKQKRITGIGASTHKALSELSLGGHWALVGRRGEMAAGNGAAMRVAPLGFCLDPKDPEARKVIRDVSRITHHSEEAYVGALAVLAAIRAAWEGRWTVGSRLVPLVLEHLPDSSVRDRIIEISEFGETATIMEVARQFGSSGYVVESIPFVLAAVQKIKQMGFQQVLEEIISAGGDTDTNAAVAGQIIGTLIGRASLPREMIDRLPDLNMIEETAKAFSETVSKGVV